MDDSSADAEFEENGSSDGNAEESDEDKEEEVPDASECILRKLGTPAVQTPADAAAADLGLIPV
jgi:hypothetical protein